MILCEKIEDLSMYAYNNADLLTAPARGMVLCFHGLGKNAMVQEGIAAYADVLEDAAYYARRNILYLYPYSGPWSWMNDVAVRYIDDVVDTAVRLLALPADVPIVSTGGSMGGLGALVYCCYSAHPMVACAANCPVCDLPYHYTERRDLPRTMRVAFGHYPCSLAEAVEMHSPLHLLSQMPNIPYYILHGEADRLVKKEFHSDRFVAAMRAAGKDVTYVEAPGMGHCACRKRFMPPIANLPSDRFFPNNTSAARNPLRHFLVLFLAFSFQTVLYKPRKKRYTVRDIAICGGHHENHYCKRFV